MAEVDFDEFVRARSGRLLRIAYALTRDHTRAEDLLQTALARCWGAWRRIDGDPEPYVRRSLVNTYNSWWRRRWRDELPSETVPDRPQEPAQNRIDDRDGVWQALGRLPRRQRAVLVLRYYEDMTEAQVAELLGVTVGTVKSTAAKALARLRTDDGLREFRTPEVPAGQERVAAVHERIEARRRSRLAVTGAAVVVVLALILGYAFAAHRRNDHPVTPTPSPSGSLSFAYPEWDEGEHVVASDSKSMRTDGVIVTAGGSDRELRVRFICHASSQQLAGRIQARLVVTSRDPIDGIQSVDIRCGVDDTVGHDLGLRPAADRLEFPQTARFPHGMTVGMTFTLDGHLLGAEQLPEAVAAWAAVVEVVPFESFVFPPRPDVLRGLSPPAVGLTSKNGYRLRIGNGPRPTKECVYSQTPGAFRLAVDGKLVDTLTIWDYTTVGACTVVDMPPLSASSVLTATAEQATPGEWYVGFD